MGILDTLMRAVTWWNGSTIGTQIFTARHGVRVGEDAAGNVFVAGKASDNVFRVSPTDVVTLVIDKNGNFSGDLLDAPEGLAVGPGGALWVTGGASDNVWRVTPAGSIFLMATKAGDGLGNPLLCPRGVACDAQGNAYVAGFDSDNVFRITPGGTITQIIDSTALGLLAKIAIITVISMYSCSLFLMIIKLCPETLSELRSLFSFDLIEGVRSCFGI